MEQGGRELGEQSQAGLGAGCVAGVGLRHFIQEPSDRLSTPPAPRGGPIALITGLRQSHLGLHLGGLCDVCGILGTGEDTRCTDHQVEAAWGRSDLRAGSGRGAGSRCGLGKGGAPGSGGRGERSREITEHK